MGVVLNRSGTLVELSGEPWGRGVRRLVHPSGCEAPFLGPALAGHHYFTGEWPRSESAVEYEPHESPGELHATGAHSAGGRLHQRAPRYGGGRTESRCLVESASR